MKLKSFILTVLAFVRAFFLRIVAGCFLLAGVLLVWFLFSFVPKYNAAGEILRNKDINDLFEMNSVVGVFDRDGKLLATLGEQKPKLYPLAQLDPRFVKGVQAVEDRRYYAWWRKYIPIDPLGTLRAIKINIGVLVKTIILRQKPKENIAGGSTILQMFSRTVFPEVGHGRTLERKLWELAFSYQLSSRYTQDDLLAAFICRANFGSVNGVPLYGVEQAASGYYQKKVEELSLDEVATLVGVLNANTAYNPVLNPTTSQKRRNIVLSMWEDQRLITAVERKELAAKPIVTNPKKAGSKYGEFTQAVKTSLSEWQEIRAELMANGVVLPPDELLRIETTLHDGMQDLWVRSFRLGLSQLPNNLKAAGGVMDWRTGEVLSVYGGGDFFNRFTEATRQPGSVFKLFVYALALAEGKIAPDSIFMDEPRSFQYENGTREYSPGNYKDEYTNAPITAAEALAKSKNVIAIEVAERVGYDRVVNFARDLGLELVADGKGNLMPTPAIALGVYETTIPQLMSALSVFANGGKQVTPRYIKSVSGLNGQVYYTMDVESVERINSTVAAAVTAMMVACADHGTGKGIFSGLIALKTGSSRDGWLVGFTPGGLLFVVYVGYDNPTGQKTNQITGAGTAGKVVGPFLAEASAMKDPFVQALFAGSFPVSNWNGVVVAGSPASSPSTPASPCAVWSDCLKQAPQSVGSPQANPSPIASPMPSPARTWRDYKQAVPKPTQVPQTNKKPMTAPAPAQAGPCSNWRDCKRQSQ